MSDFGRATCGARRVWTLLAAALAALGLLGVPTARAQEAIVKAEELIALQPIPLSRPMPFEMVHSYEELDHLAWISMRALDTSNTWNPRHRAWKLYYSNVRYDLERELRSRWDTAAGTIRSLSQNPDTALAKHYADAIPVAELDDALVFYRGSSGKRYTAYLRELRRTYHRGMVELERIAIDREFGEVGDTLTARRQAWLKKKKVTLDPPPAGYEFHVKAAQSVFPATQPRELVFALIAGAPPGTDAFQRLERTLTAAEREDVSRFLASSFSQNEKRAQKTWADAIAKSRDLPPLVIRDVRGLVDFLLKWRKTRADPRALPRSIAEIDPASVDVTERYETVEIDDAAFPGFVKKCMTVVSDSTIAAIVREHTGKAGGDVMQVLSNASSRNLFLARQGKGACISTTAPGYPVPALDSFVGTVRVVGMSDEDNRRWYREIAQELAAAGASDSLLITDNGNAFEVTFAVNVAKPYTMIYFNRLLFAGTYDTERYRIVHRVPGFRSLSSIARTVAGAAAHEKVLLTTAAEIRRDEELRARDSAARAQ